MITKKLKKAIKKLDKHVVQKGTLLKKELRKAADDIEPVIKEARKSLLKLGKRINKKIIKYHH